MSTATLEKTRIPTGTWAVDAAHSKIGFAVKHLGVATVRGEFTEFEGALEVGEDLSQARAYGRVKADSIDTNQAQRDEHLRSADFFSSEKHPEITFESKRIDQVDEDTFRIVGDLSLNGVTNEVELEAEFGGVGTGQQGEERIGLEVTGQVSRKAYEMKFDTANAVVGDKVKLQLDIAAVKQG